MTDKLIRGLLNLIANYGEIEELEAAGFTDAQIGQAILEARRSGLFENSEEGYRLTEKGNTILTQLPPFEKISTLDEWRIEKLSLDEIYIPDKLRVRRRRQNH